MALHQMFAARAAEHPGRISVTEGDRAHSYADLDRASDRVTHNLWAAGARPGDNIGLYADRGFDFVAGMLGILKFGAVYVPMDPRLPAARIEHVAVDAGITHAVTADDVPVDDLLRSGLKILRAGEEGDLSAGAFEPPPADPSALAYIIYTSGSTGTPKGVPIEHRQVISLFEGAAGLYGFDADDVWTQFHSVGFDFSVWEIWGALLFGGRLVIVPRGMTRSPGEFRRLLADERVTVLSQTPSAFRQLVAADARMPAADHRLRLVVFGGERLDFGILRPWLERYGDATPQLVNMYGITETCVHVTHRTVRTADLDDTVGSPIGCPLPGVEVYLLDEDGAEVPTGTPGGIFVGGTGVGRGYLGQPRLTAERFVRRNVSGTDVLLYDSGDRAVRTPDGELLFLGRSDDQLSVLGHRIEPQEVEICLAAHPWVRAAVVFSKDHGEGDVRLTAHLVLAPEAERERALAEVGEHVAARLPEHLRPVDCAVVDELLLTPQGKVDRAAHAAAELPGVPEVPVTAGNGVDAVAAVVADVLRREVKDRDLDLFDIGVTSLAFVRIIAAVNARFGTELTGSELQTVASISQLAACVDEHLART
ncbi:amino acid adenylation domain-containing protein [Actinomadura vinacea]|uniref:Amino acid adenylation domain-containing protein n=1 Tax=Actinomadura vinacea TaxID=115336 RepID=A0ABP5XM00_9ACTN